MSAVPELERDLVSAYGAHYPMLYRRARRWLPSDEAEDLVQETYLRAWTHHGDHDPGLPWLLTVLRNLAIDRSRKKHADPVGDASVLDGPGAERTEDVVVALDEWRRVRIALDGLTHGQREAIRLREWEGLSQREIARTLGTTEPAVESLLLRGRRRLRRALDRAMGLVLWPFAWRRMHGANSAGDAVGAAPAVTSGWAAAVANLATAATVMVAGAAAPMGHDAPPGQDRVVAAAASSDSSSPEAIRAAAAFGGTEDDGSRIGSDSDGGLTGSQPGTVTQEPMVSSGSGGGGTVSDTGGTRPGDTDTINERPAPTADPSDSDDGGEVEDPRPPGGGDPEGPGSGSDNPALPAPKAQG